MAHITETKSNPTIHEQGPQKVPLQRKGMKYELLTLQLRTAPHNEAIQTKEDRKRLAMQRIKLFMKDGNDAQTVQREPEAARKNMAILLDTLEKAINAQKDT